MFFEACNCSCLGDVERKHVGPTPRFGKCTMSLHRVLQIFLFGAVLLAGCGDDTGPAASPFGAAPANGQLIITANGGAGIGGTVGNGGGCGAVAPGQATITAICRGNVYIGLNPAP